MSKSAIPDRRELKKSFNDADGVCAWDTIWINKFEESTKTVSKDIGKVREKISGDS